jgi:hypothetical protein
MNILIVYEVKKINAAVKDMYFYIYVYIYINKYIYRERETERSPLPPQTGKCRPNTLPVLCHMLRFGKFNS